MLPAFSIARLPRIEFGAGAIDRLPALAAVHGRRALLVLGAASFQGTPQWQRLQAGLRAAGLDWRVASVTGESSPELVDELVAEFRPANPELVIGIGGGSVLDAAKAIAGLLRGQLRHRRRRSRPDRCRQPRQQHEDQPHRAHGRGVEGRARRAPVTTP
jgi:alcohol dehydrogenase